MKLPAFLTSSARFPERLPQSPIFNKIDKALESYLREREGFINSLLRSRAVLYQTLFSHLHYAQIHARSGNVPDGFGDFYHWLQHNAAEPNMAAGIPRYHKGASIDGYLNTPPYSELHDIASRFVKNTFRRVERSHDNFRATVNWADDQFQREVEQVFAKLYPANSAQRSGYDNMTLYHMERDLGAMSRQGIREYGSGSTGDSALYDRAFTPPKELTAHCTMLATLTSQAREDLPGFLQRQWEIPTPDEIVGAIGDDKKLQALIDREIENVTEVLTQLAPSLATFYARMDQIQKESSVSWETSRARRLTQFLTTDLDRAGQELGRLVTAKSITNRPNYFTIEVNRSYYEQYGFISNPLILQGRTDREILDNAGQTISSLEGVMSISPYQTAEKVLLNIEVQPGSPAAQLLNYVELSLVRNQGNWAINSVTNMSWYSRSEGSQSLVRSMVQNGAYRGKNASMLDFDPQVLGDKAWDDLLSNRQSQDKDWTQGKKRWTDKWVDQPYETAEGKKR